jgi:hypothetical protein
MTLAEKRVQQRGNQVDFSATSENGEDSTGGSGFLAYAEESADNDSGRISTHDRVSRRISCASNEDVAIAQVRRSRRDCRGSDLRGDGCGAVGYAVGA